VAEAVETVVVVVAEAVETVAVAEAVERVVVEAVETVVVEEAVGPAMVEDVEVGEEAAVNPKVVVVEVDFNCQSEVAGAESSSKNTLPFRLTVV
jgi:hypothetical protein